jgi:hypothetical protein
VGTTNLVEYSEVSVKDNLYLHLLSFGSSTSSTGVGFDKSSKFIINNDISSTSERIGAITSEHKNFAPEILQSLTLKF